MRRDTGGQVRKLRELRCAIIHERKRISRALVQFFAHAWAEVHMQRCKDHELFHMVSIDRNGCAEQGLCSCVFKMKNNSTHLFRLLIRANVKRSNFGFTIP
jgi:hypothetical protein